MERSDAIVQCESSVQTGECATQCGVSCVEMMRDKKCAVWNDGGEKRGRCAV